ncbi:MAG: hypothetical protein FJW88_15140, partial [Actinobacteria bacterium]|nr:hypothetical protein [Actinomycetota bacterium]
MRIRTLLLAGLLAVGMVMAMPTGAHASGGGPKEVFECVEKAIENNTEGKSVDYEAFENALEDCKKAKSLVTPALPEIIWGGIAFLIVLA